jgi:hypothetical protein
MTSERIGRWKKVVEEAKGFDAFEDMLDDVVLAHRVEKRKDTLSPSAPASAMQGAGSLSGISARSAANLPAATAGLPPVTPSRDLSAAGRAFGAFADDESGEAPPSAARASSAATQAFGGQKPDNPSKAGVSAGAGSKAKSPATRESPAKSEAKSETPRPPRGPNKPMTLAEISAAKAGALAGSGAAPAVAQADARRATDSVPRREQSLGPGARWLMSVVALVLISAFSLLVCYYVLAWFGHMGGNFLNLPLPGLPPAKAAHAALSHAAVSLSLLTTICPITKTSPKRSRGSAT